jgi:hypothetical protein
VLFFTMRLAFQFLTLAAGDERLQLIPVLCTMLKFSPEEKDELVKIASGGWIDHSLLHGFE